jgi:hypothetical protein
VCSRPILCRTSDTGRGGGACDAVGVAKGAHLARQQVVHRVVDSGVYGSRASQLGGGGRSSQAGACAAIRRGTDCYPERADSRRCHVVLFQLLEDVLVLLIFSQGFFAQTL